MPMQMACAAGGFAQSKAKSAKNATKELEHVLTFSSQGGQGYLLWGVAMARGAHWGGAARQLVVLEGSRWGNQALLLGLLGLQGCR
jgi:hypothetical protein